MLEDILLREPPESKILLSLLSGGVICAGALLVCWLSGSSPSGASFCCILHGRPGPCFWCTQQSHCLVVHLMHCHNVLLLRQVERTCPWRAARRLRWA